jgi:predicted RNase H-like HicB family nuclease
MERIIRLQIEKLPEGVYLATSEDVQGLIAQGRTIQETIEIARDVARVIQELRGEAAGESAQDRETFELPIVIAA